MQRAEKKERKEISEKERAEMQKEKRPRGRPPKDSGVLDFHMSLRLGPEHLFVIDAIGKSASRSETLREMIMVFGKKMKVFDEPQ